MCIASCMHQRIIRRCLNRVPKKSLQIISNNQVEKHASQNRSDTGNDRCGDAVIPFALIDLIGGTAPDKEVDNQSTRQNRGQDHQPRCQIGNEFFGSGCNLAVSMAAETCLIRNKKAAGIAASVTSFLILRLFFFFNRFLLSILLEMDVNFPVSVLPHNTSRYSIKGSYQTAPPAHFVLHSFVF